MVAVNVIEGGFSRSCTFWGLCWSKMANHNSFVAWEEHIICHDKGSRVVHFYLKNVSGEMVLAVVGTERSIRHMMYVLSDEFLQAYGAEGFGNGCTKWRARREVVDWLTSLVKDSSTKIILILYLNLLYYHKFSFLIWNISSNLKF